MSDTKSYTPPNVWKWEAANGGKFAKINRPIAGATHDKPLPVGNHPLQLYSLGTPNGVKVTVMLEELLTKGHKASEYDAWLIKINEGDQFSSGFVNINPNSKIPALVDYSVDTPSRIFESGAIVFYLAEKFNEFLPQTHPERAECLSWLFWHMGSAPFLGGGFGHFYSYAPEKLEYPINRYAMEVKRQLDVLNRRLEKTEYLCGDNYSIADIGVWAWYGQLVLGRLYNADQFLDVTSYDYVVGWAKLIDQRPAVKRGRMVNRTFGNPAMQLHERHNATDFDLKTQDKFLR